MDKFDEHEVCPACGNDPVESGLKWKPRFTPGVPKKEMNRLELAEQLTGIPNGERLPESDYLLVSCGQCKYQLKRACLNEV